MQRDSGPSQRGCLGLSLALRSSGGMRAVHCVLGLTQQRRFHMREARCLLGHRRQRRCGRFTSPPPWTCSRTRSSSLFFRSSLKSAFTGQHPPRWRADYEPALRRALACDDGCIHILAPLTAGTVQAAQKPSVTQATHAHIHLTPGSGQLLPISVYSSPPLR